MSESCPFNQDSLEKLKLFINLISRDPQLIHHPQLRFFQQYLTSLGANIPTPSSSPTMEAAGAPKHADGKESEEKDEVVDSDESEIEFDMEGCIEGDKVDEAKQLMGSPDKVVGEEDSDKADEKRMEAMAAVSDGDFEKAINLFTEAIIINPTVATLFVKRAQSYLKLNKPNACIRDCSRALELNPDSAAAYKSRGRANRLLGNWEEAANDLRQAGIIDYDEELDEWLKEVAPNAQKILQHKMKQERKKTDRDIKERLERIKLAKEAQAKAAAEANVDADDGFGDFNPEGAGAGAGMSDFYKLFQDPEVMTAFKDPEVAAAFQDISVNPANFTKYQSNPKVMNILTKLSSKMGAGKGFPGGMGGFPGGMGGFPGGMGGFPGGMGGFGGSNETKRNDEDGLD